MDISQKYETEIYCVTDSTGKEFDLLIQDVIHNLKSELNIQNTSKFNGKNHVILKESPIVQISHEKGSQNEGYIIKISVSDTSSDINPTENKNILKQVYNQISIVFPNVRPMN